ncbi:hypothetical protein RHSIM_Rhsim13G0211300 [Rhododendron simsii]|uniref:RING-type E3 ubiquitin transferase n=1 Tax=Rhododendron simsii TaxID=118357 RepID=A0A834G1P7_RHOSS|nr:hypothetical protein RHSIM_Rhsim13G0211300 [Rhododendron simsii]
MDEIQIAKSKAEILDKLTNSSNYPGNPAGRVSAKLGGEEVDWERISGVTAELAWWRAWATNRDFRTVLEETELRVTVELARILEPTLDPVLKGLREVVMVEEEEEGGLCGVCQEEMEVGEDVRAMGCRHKFHVFCIYKWLKHKNVCPLCRYSGVADQ